MRKLVTVFVVVLAAAGVASAQPAPWGAPPWAAQTQGQTVTVEGKLALVNGMISVQSGGKTYYTPMLRRLVGFVDAVKEGASVKVEGYERTFASATDTSMLAVTRLTVAGKDYDLAPAAGMGPGMHGRQGGMRGGPRW
jgi:hypothetical protein